MKTLLGSFAVAVALAVPLASCGGTRAAPEGEPGALPPSMFVAPVGDLPCDVARVLEQRCQGCHASAPKYGAPMPLATYGDLFRPAPSDGTRRVADRVRARLHDDAKPMPPPPNARLEAAELAVLDRWIDSGAPSGGACVAAPPVDGTQPPPAQPPPLVTPLSCKPDVEMRAQGSWTMPEATRDQYVCYGFDLTSQEKRHLVAIGPRIGDPSIVHHLVLFEADRTVSSVPTPCSGGGGTNWRIVFGWAPGGGNFEFPAEAGFPLQGTTHYVVQIHYSNLRAEKGHVDTSGFDFCTTKELRPNDADSMVFGGTRFEIPARGEREIACDYTVPALPTPIKVWSAFPHMHQIGRSIRSELLPSAGGAPIDLGRRDVWDFQNQFYVPVDGTLRAGDRVRTTCAWSNPGDVPVRMGERTEDEMCFTFAMYYPRIADRRFSWITPSATATCTTTR